ncbi:MAG: hypothetical protein IKE85_06215 [Mogibacterium sp.]|nr:hypothetical protein [Mogibacterium sp.]
MINKDRIVPVQATDLLSLYGLILKMDSNNSTLAKLDALDVDGNFKVTSGSAPLLCSQPAESIDIDATASSVSSATIYFVPAYDYKGFTIDGSAVTPTGSVDADGVTLYKAALSSGAITITKIGF